MIRRIITLLVLSFALVAGVAAVQTAAPATSVVAPKQAAAACIESGPYPLNYCVRHFYSYDRDPVKMCKDWSGPTYTNGCSTDSGDRLFIWDAASFNSTRWDYNWNDTDGFYVPSGWSVAIAKIKVGTDGAWNRYHRNRWAKVKGCYGCNTKIKRYPQ